MSSDKPITGVDLRDPFGRHRTYSLFIETPTEGLAPLWTLKPHAYKGYPPLKDIYFSYEHIPGFEYDFAVETFGSWDHWCKLTDSSGVRATFKEWRSELEIRNKARAMRSIIRTSTESTAAGTTAAKYLSEKGYASKRGRPSNEDVERERKVQASVNQELEDDLKRVGLTVVSK